MKSVVNQDEQWLLEEKYGGEKSEAFFADCERLATGVPLAYLIGHTPFLDCTIHLDSYPLIPRPETEFWVEEAIKKVGETGLSSMKHPQRQSSKRGPAEDSIILSHTRILDLCSGSGCIGVAVAKAVPEAKVTFAEIDAEHIPTIKKNISKNVPAASVQNCKVVHSDLLDEVEGVFDFILTNPPYIDKEADTIDASVVEHEPHIALFGGKAGMEFIERIVVGARAKLVPGGQLWIEHEPFQSETIKELAKTHEYEFTTHPDQYGVQRYSILVIQ